MTNEALLKTVAICDTQPVTIEGLQSLLRTCEDLRVIGSATNLFNGLELVQNHNPAIVVIDKAFGLPAIMDWLANLRVHPDFTFHLKQSMRADLPARARVIDDLDERRRVMSRIVASLGGGRRLDDWVARSPLVEVEFLS